MASVPVDLLVGKIISILENETSLISGVKDELDELKRELTTMRSFLEDADKTRRPLTKLEKAWVDDVRDLCYPAEDIIEEFTYHMNKSKREGLKFKRILRQIIGIPKNMWVKHRVATEIQKISRSIKSAREISQRYGVDHIEGTGSSSHEDNLSRVRNQGESLLYAKDDHLVGIEHDRRLLLGWLTDGDPQRNVTSVVGMGGCGKSALVAKVFKDQTVRRHFDCYAWVTVSETYVIEDIFRRMLKEFYISEKQAVPTDLSSKGYIELLQILVDYLRPKRYVVILDDIWSSTLWNDVNVALQDEGSGSRVILTTRNDDIANNASSSSGAVTSHVLHVKLLEPSDDWDLFCNKVFYPDRSCPEELKEAALNLVAKCGGLPLAILTLGGVMSSKKLVSEWMDFSASLNEELNSKPDLEVVKVILFRSFIDLPYQMKRCFLYCCMFPEDYEIRRKRLIRLWVAEGFVEKVRAKTPERIAEDYLMELVHRSMLEVVRRNEWGRPKACKMHDLMRELALSKSETEKLCAVYDGRQSSEAIHNARRLSIQKITQDIKSFKGMSQLRSLFVFVADTIYPSSAINLPARLRLLRVLDLQDTSIEKLPDEVVDLFNLRYLNLRKTKVKELPKSIGRLRNLLTLDIRDSKIEVLPAQIVKMQNLRHIIMYRYNRSTLGHDFCYVYGTQAPSTICSLKNLQVLSCVERSPNLLKELSNMTQLTRIGITKLRRADEFELCDSIRSMYLLRYLFLMATDEDECLGIDKLSSTPPCLQNLILVGRLEKVPRWFGSLGSLTFLYLHWSRLREDLIQHIQTLPNLGSLTLINAYVGNKLHFSTGFNKLKILTLYNFAHLNLIIIEKGVMPDLKEMKLGHCSELKILPHGIEYLMNLEKLELRFVSSELVESVSGEESTDRLRVRHIPEINHYYQSTFGIFYQSLSGFN